ncbi:MAG TPA: tRNA (adenosine(37)-N6)-threonylcarbamoyltransferase complex ATPase subunit type 1 TsaE [Candidatus Limnocylindria bacterium]
MERSTVPAGRQGSLVSADPEETRAIGRSLGRAAAPGTVLAVRGELGAGKTQLAKGVAEGLGVTTIVNSPTFVLMNEHVGRLRLYHVDAYRLTDPEEAVAAGLLDEREIDGVSVIEWADRLEGWLPLDRLDITLVAGAGPTDRRISWAAHGEAPARLAEVLGPT